MYVITSNAKLWMFFLSLQSEKAKRAGNTPTTETVAEYLAKMSISPGSDEDKWEPLILEEESHVNARASTLSVSNI